MSSGATALDPSQAVPAAPRPVPAVATMLELPTLIAALEMTLKPSNEAHVAALQALREDISIKHAENRTSRHDLRNTVDTALSSVQADIFNARERLAQLEIKVGQATGDDGRGGAIRELKIGQDAQLSATKSLEATVTVLSNKFDEFAPILEEYRQEKRAKERNRIQRLNLKEIFDMILKATGVLGAAWWLVHHIH